MKLHDDAHMLLQVHDELVFEIREEKLDAVVPEIVKIMTGVVSEEDGKGVPLEVEVKVGDNWEEMTKYNLETT